MKFWLDRLDRKISTSETEKKINCGNLIIRILESRQSWRISIIKIPIPELALVLKLFKTTIYENFFFSIKSVCWKFWYTTKTLKVKFGANGLKKFQYLRHV